MSELEKLYGNLPKFTSFAHETMFAALTSGNETKYKNVRHKNQSNCNRFLIES